MKNLANFFPILFTFISLLFVGGCNEGPSDPPIITTGVATSLTYSSVSIRGEDSRGGDISEVGICWNTTGNPTRNDFKVVCNYSWGQFFGTLSNLNSNTKYFARAYGIHKGQTFYGNVISFTTDYNISASISTSSITSTAATVKGAAINVGNFNEVGITWSSQGYPYVGSAFNIACDVHTDGSFSADLTGLAPNTHYYVRPYIVKGGPIFYGNVFDFTTSK